jgi:hypothetical protein
LVLYISYSWGGNYCALADFDGAVYFLGGARGFSCNPFRDAYIAYSGDGYGPFGSETFQVYLGKASTDGQWSGSTTVQLRAGWRFPDLGLVNVTLSTKRFLADGTSVDDNNTISFVVDPPRATGCPSPLANATVSIYASGTVSIFVPK